VSGHNVLDNYAASVVLCLLHSGAMEPLVALGLGIDESNGWCTGDGPGGKTSGKSNGSRDNGLSRPATRVLSLLIQTATRLLPKKVSSRVLSDLQHLVSAATHRNQSGSTLMHAGKQHSRGTYGWVLV
jgi:hypothetical protein